MGGDAMRSAWPLGVRGAPGSRNVSHCAVAAAQSTNTKASTRSELLLLIDGRFPASSWRCHHAKWVHSQLDDSLAAVYQRLIAATVGRASAKGSIPRSYLPSRHRHSMTASSLLRHSEIINTCSAALL